MPIYDFECKNCGYSAEVIRKMSEANIAACPKCQQETFAKKISAPSFQLNGTGWYATDFKNNSKRTPAPEANQDAAPSAPCGSGCACH